MYVCISHIANIITDCKNVTWFKKLSTMNYKAKKKNTKKKKKKKKKSTATATKNNNKKTEVPLGQCYNCNLLCWQAKR